MIVVAEAMVYAKVIGAAKHGSARSYGKIKKWSRGE
jgi:hypothetical protein